MIDMEKYIVKIVTSIIFCVVLLCSCNESDEYNEDNIQAVNTQKYSETVIQNKKYEEMNVSEKVYTITDYKDIDISGFDCTRLNLEAYSGNNLFFTYLNDELMKIYKINTDSGEQEYISAVEYNVMNIFLSQVVDDRYFVIMPSKNSSAALQSTLYVYDIETEDFYAADNFMAHNMVQYMTNIGNDKLAYLYYEAATMDIVVKVYDFVSKTSKEIYRLNSEDKFSPMGLTFNGENILLTFQYYNESFETETLFKEIDLSGNDINSYISKEFPLELICNIKFSHGYYIVCGYRLRATREYSAVYVDTSNNEINTVLSLDFDLKNPLNHTNIDYNIDMFRCNKKSDFARVDLDNKSLQYFSVDIPDCNCIYSAVCNEKNDIAVIKYSDENYSKYKLALVENDNRGNIR